MLAFFCGVCPVQASSGQRHRHRSAVVAIAPPTTPFRTIANNRMIHDSQTREFVETPCQHGINREDTLRVLKRYIAEKPSASSDTRCAPKTFSLRSLDIGASTPQARRSTASTRPNTSLPCVPWGRSRPSPTWNPPPPVWSTGTRPETPFDLGNGSTLRYEPLLTPNAAPRSVGV